MFTSWSPCPTEERKARLALTAGSRTCLGGRPCRGGPQPYRVECENARVRLLRVKYGAREKSVMHRHPATLAISLTGRDWKITLPDGRTRNIMGRPGEIIGYEAHEHVAENLSSKPYEGIHIELKTCNAELFRESAVQFPRWRPDGWGGISRFECRSNLIRLGIPLLSCPASTRRRARPPGGGRSE